MVHTLPRLMEGLRDFGLSPNDWHTQRIHYKPNGEWFTVQLVHREDPDWQIRGIARCGDTQWLGLQLSGTDHS